MSNINPFILTGMMPLSASSMNRVSYMCPVTISNDVVQGQTDIQDSLTVDSGGNLYIINAPVYVGGPNQPDHGHRTAHLVIRNGGAMTLLGNLPDHMTVFLGDKANGSLEINGGRLLMGQGRIQGTREHEGRIAMTDGWLFASEVDLPAEGSELVIRHGLMRIRKLSGNASTRIYGGVLHVKEEARASRIHLIDDGVLLLGSVTSQPSADVMAGAGINFRGDGGALVIRIPHPENALTRTREAEHVFDELLRRGKLFHDSEPMTSFQGFHMREFTGHDGLAYAALRPSAQLNAEQNQVTRLLHTFMYGGSEKDMPILTPPANGKPSSKNRRHSVPAVFSSVDLLKNGKTLFQEFNREGSHIIVIPVRRLDGSDNGENDPGDNHHGGEHEPDQDQT